MSVYLLTWSPKRYNWQRLPYLAFLSAQGWPVPHDWSCQQTKRIRDGDRFFMLRYGDPPNGIMASGMVISPKPYRGKNPNKSRSRRTVYFIDVDFDAILDPDSDPPLPVSHLKRGRLAAVNWERPRAGMQIPEDAARQLESLWKKHLARIEWQGKVYLD
jgi:hypothetical protein